MKILFVVPYSPNLVRVRPYNLLRSLSERGHEITLVCPHTDVEERGQLERYRESLEQIITVKLPRYQSLLNCVRAVPTSDPLQAHYCWQPELANQMLEALTKSVQSARYEIAHVEHLRGARYGSSLVGWRKRSGNRLPVVWDSVDSISLLFQQARQKSRSPLHRWITGFELERTRRYEARMLDVFDRVLVTSSKDRNHFLKLRSSKVLRAEISILPNGVDLDYFQYQPQPNGRSKVIVMTGKMSYHANISMVRHFYENIYPSVQAGHSDVELWIVGKDPSPEILAMRSDRSVTVTGTVSDIRPYLAKATLAVAPVTYGAGIQNKVLEAMAVGTPVVSSPEAISALGVEPERDLSVAANPEEFARKIIRLIDRTEARSSLSQAGRQYVENHHSWETIAEQLEGIYCELISA